MISQYSDNNLIKLSGEESVSRAIGAMQEKGVKDIVVIDGDKICLVDPHRILKIRTSTKNTKLKSIMYTAPTLSANSDLIDAIKLMIQNGLDAIPLKDKGNVAGIITEARLMKELIMDKQFGNMSADAIMTRNPILIKDTDKLVTARNTFIDNNIEHLPVVDKTGRLVGILYEKDLLRAVLHEEDHVPQMDRTKKASPWDAPVKDIVDSNVAIIHYKDMIKKAMTNTSFTSCLVVMGEDGRPVGIITPKDVLELVELPKNTGVYVQIAGMQEEDEFEKKEAHAEVDRTVQKISATANVHRLLVHVKRYAEGGKVKYSIRAKLVTDSTVYNAHAWEWNLIQAVGGAMKMLEKQVFKNKSKKLDQRKHGGKSGSEKKSKAKRKK